MHKFFVNKENINEDCVKIIGNDVKHIYKVLRLKVGEEININNCEGKEFLAKIKNISKTEVIAQIIKKIDINNESKINIYLFQGFPKSSKMDLIVQKATEIGVKEITPIITNRVIVKNQSKEFKKIDRWSKIALEACKQCKRSVIPFVKSPLKFEELLDNLKKMDLIVVPYENESGYGIKNMANELKEKDLKNIAVVIGPEGGFEEKEIELLKDIGSYIVTLGKRILRTETAGLVCASLLMYEFGDIGGKY